ncbi:MAG: DUF3524 domain-containing protein [Phycisphaerae bacterium]|nr:DUF3524 domain-containing protein [Phycisphaerae bacterium]
MRILALEPYHGGSHKAFLDGWIAHSQHAWTVLGLPAYKWKWRMRHAAITFAEQVAERVAAGERWDALFCSDMLNLAEFLGLAPTAVRSLPTVAYFHENQLTYPVRQESERDWHFAFTNLTTALAATQVWFNSAFHRDAWLGAMAAFLPRMPDCQPTDAVDRIRRKAIVYPPGVAAFEPRGPRNPGPMRILWAARWEHDKDPDTFFAALNILRHCGVDFRISVVGEQFREQPPIFEQARHELSDRIDRWGFQPTRKAYEEALGEADIIISTARHEFFGISVVEAIAAGAWPLLPRRLAYPEILSAAGASETDRFFYAGDADALADRLAELAGRIEAGTLWDDDPTWGARTVARFTWPVLGPRLDGAIAELCKRT